jgi:hypothetical protein
MHTRIGLNQAVIRGPTGKRSLGTIGIEIQVYDTGIQRDRRVVVQLELSYRSRAEIVEEDV